MRKLIAVLSLALLAIGMAGAIDVRETSWGVPFVAPDPSLKTTDPFYGGLGATILGQESTYKLPAVLTGEMVRETEDDPWMDIDGGKNSTETVLKLAGAGELTDPQIDKLYGGQVPEAMPWM